MNTLEKAQRKKEHFENNNKKLKDFIKKIKDFLMGLYLLDTMLWQKPQTSVRCVFNLLSSPEEGADPESIEKVALHVLSIRLPVNKTILDNMVTQIKGHLSNLTNIEDIVNQTSQHVNKAKELLEKAKEAK